MENSNNVQDTTNVGNEVFAAVSGSDFRIVEIQNIFYIQKKHLLYGFKFRKWKLSFVPYNFYWDYLDEQGRFFKYDAMNNVKKKQFDSLEEAEKYIQMLKKGIVYHYR